MSAQMSVSSRWRRHLRTGWKRKSSGTGLAFTCRPALLFPTLPTASEPPLPLFSSKATVVFSVCFISWRRTHYFLQGFPVRWYHITVSFQISCLLYFSNTQSALVFASSPTPTRVPLCASLLGELWPAWKYVASLVAWIQAPFFGKPSRLSKGSSVYYVATLTLLCHDIVISVGRSVSPHWTRNVWGLG